MILKRFTLPVFLLLMVAGAALAERPLGHIYQAEVPLRDRSDAARQQAFQQAMAQVLVKISGYSGTPGFPAIQAELRRADQYLLEFAIESRPLPRPDGIGVQPGEVLWVRFNQQLIDQLVRDYELPLWPSSRPEIRLGLQARLGAEQVALDERSHPAAAALLDQLAYRRGLHLVLRQPRGEQEADYAGLLSLDYDRFGGILARIELSDQRGMPGFVEARGDNLEQALTRAFDQLVDQLALQTSFVAGRESGNSVLVRLSGVSSFRAYQLALESLRSLEMVNELRVVWLNLDEVQFNLRIGASPAQLADALSRRSIFQVDTRPGTGISLDSGREIRLRYLGAGGG